MQNRRVLIKSGGLKKSKINKLGEGHLLGTQEHISDAILTETFREVGIGILIAIVLRGGFDSVIGVDLLTVQYLLLYSCFALFF